MSRSKSRNRSGDCAWDKLNEENEREHKFNDGDQ